MDKLLFMKPLLNVITQGSFFRKVSAAILKALAFVVLFIGIVAFIKAWKIILELPAAGIIGGIIYQLLFIIAVYMVIHILIIRACEITNLPDSDYPVVSITTILFRLVGEVYASFVAVIAVGGGILLWFTGYEGQFIIGSIINCIPMSELISCYTSGTFLGGLLFIVFGLLAAFFTLVFFYLSAELLLVTFDIARNIKKLNRAED